MASPTDGLGRLRIQEWPEGVVVFDRASGDTHALDPLSSAIFLNRERFRHNVASLPAFLRANHPGLAVPEDDAAVQSAIDKLISLGLWRNDAS